MTALLGSAQTAEIIELHSGHAPQMTLQELVKSIIHHVYIARDSEGKMGRSRLKAGREMLLLRKRVESGDPEAEGLTWWKYYARDLKGHFRSRRDAEKIMAMARADNPEAAADEEVGETRERMRRQRAAHVRRDLDANDTNSATELTTEQAELIDHVCQIMVDTSDETRRRFVAVLKGRLQL